MTPQSQQTIYALTDAGTGEVRYVGRTRNTAEVRKRQHVYGARLRNGASQTYVSRWIRSADFNIGVVVLEVVPFGQDYREAERIRVERFKAQGARLTNLTRGGEGCPARGVLLSQAHRDRLREFNIGYWQGNTQRRERLSQSNRERWANNPEAKKRFSFKGRKQTPEARAVLSARRKAWWSSQAGQRRKEFLRGRGVGR